MKKSVIKQVSVEVVPWEHPPMSFTDKASLSTAPVMLGKSELAIIRIVD
jgi:hypothetical protein